MANQITQVEVKTLSCLHRSPLSCALAITLCWTGSAATANAQQGDSWPSSVAAFVDFNGDGKLDAVVVGGGGAVVGFGNGDGTFVPTVPLSGSNGNNCLSVAAADFNGDGKADVV